MTNGTLEDKNHPYRESKTYNKLVVGVRCPYNEAIIDENRIEQALRAAFGIPDLEVISVTFEVAG